MIFSLTDVAALFSILSALIYLWYQRKPGKGETVKHAALNIDGDTVPLPDPYLDFDLETAHTRNHIYVNKTLRFPYFQTMAHQPMHINDWIEIDKDYSWYLDQKAKVIKEKGKIVVDSLPENDEACAELLEVLVDYLPKRFPTLFESVGTTGIYNKITGESFQDISGKRGIDALMIVSKLVQDDFLMGRARDDGHVYFVGGLIAFPGFYFLSDYIGKPLEEVHRDVPYFNEKILMSVERTLKRFKPNEPFERTSWTMADDRNLYRHNMVDAKRFATNTLEHPQDMWMRMDHQTFRKLPRSNGIVFGVHVILKRLEDLVETPLVPALLAKLHLEGDKVLMEYKLDAAYKDRILPYLQDLTKRQLDLGLISEADLDKVADFRSLVRDGVVPNPQTSLSRPTESEEAGGMIDMV